MEVKQQQNVKRKIPMFQQIRRTFHAKNTPKVNLQLAYRNKENEEITIVRDEVTPKSRFPSQQYEQMYEIATVEVNILS